jgi:NADP-dependent 3-hydroxy acid dehydrogenase YdfG
VPQQAALAMAQEFDKLDLAFNNAGGHADMKPIDQTTKKEPEWVIGLNFKALYYGVKYEAECMLKGGGRLVNTASTFGLKAMPEIAHAFGNCIPMHRIDREVAEAVLCLMSDKTSYAADSVLSIDGGIYAG